MVKDQEITECDVSVTNKEVMGMFRTEIMGMFHNGMSICNEFAQALVIVGNVQLLGQLAGDVVAAAFFVISL